ncbi:Tetraspanin family protein [Entamoeba marina]
MYLPQTQYLKLVNLLTIVVGVFLIFHGLTHSLFSRHPENEISQKSVTIVSLITGALTVGFSFYCYRKYHNFERSELHIEKLIGGILLILLCIITIFTTSITVFSIKNAVKNTPLLNVETEFDCCGWFELREYCMKDTHRTCYHVLVTPHNTYKAITTLISILQVIHLIILSILMCVAYKPKTKPDFYSMYTNIGEGN